MLILSIDLETTGLPDDLETQILEIGAVLMNDGTVVSDFKKTIHYDTFRGSAFALQMNHRILQKIAFSPEECVSLSFCKESFKNWLVDNLQKCNEGIITLAGKNFASFDLVFLKREGFLELNSTIKVVDDFKPKSFAISTKILDVAPLFFEPGDKELPSLSLCKKRAGMDEVVTHDALEDAYDIINLLKYKNVV